MSYYSLPDSTLLVNSREEGLPQRNRAVAADYSDNRFIFTRLEGAELRFRLRFFSVFVFGCVKV